MAIHNSHTVHLHLIRFRISARACFRLAQHSNIQNQILHLQHFEKAAIYYSSGGIWTTIGLRDGQIAFELTYTMTSMDSKFNLIVYLFGFLLSMPNAFSQTDTLSRDEYYTIVNNEIFALPVNKDKDFYLLPYFLAVEIEYCIVYKNDHGTLSKVRGFNYENKQTIGIVLMPEGNLFYIDKYHNSFDHYDQITYYPNGETKSLLLGYKTKSTLTEYHPNGLVATIGKYSIDDGYYDIKQTFYESGQLLSISVYADDKSYLTKIFDKEGYLLYTAEISTQGKAQGKVTYYNKRGKEIGNAKYHDGYLIKSNINIFRRRLRKIPIHATFSE